ncbi:laminin G domain-containing protein, partial [bacterium]|nr:laminin G domain-containing protein [bacterium]
LNITDAITIEAWVKPTSLAWQGIATKWGSEKCYSLSTHWSHDGKAHFFLGHGGALYYQVVGTTILTNTGWHHLAGTYDGSWMRLYVDGVEEGTPVNQVFTIPTTATDLTIGSWSPGSHPFHGAIDEVRIYKRALSADEIADHADSTIVITKSQDLGDNSPRGVLLSSTFDADSPVVWKTIEWNDPSAEANPYGRGDGRLRKDESGLVALWHFDEGVDLSGESAHNSTVYDESTNSNTGIVQGCKWGDVSEDSAVFQSALSFDGDGDYVDCGNVGSSRTIEFWIKTDSEDTPILELSSSDTVYVSGGSVGVSEDFGETIYVDGNEEASLSTGTWHHVAITSDEITADAVKIGKAGSDYFSGAIDEVAIYSRAKTADEIWQDARGTQIRLRTQTTSSILDGTGADSAVGLWHFDNQDLDNPSSTDVYDSSVYGNDGTRTGATWSQYGVFGKCLSFDGTDDYVDCLAISAINASDSSSFSVSFWFKTSNGDAGLWEMYHSGSNRNAACLYGGKIKTGSWDGNNWEGGITSNTYNDNNWHHCTIIKDGTTHKIYVDGASDWSSSSYYSGPSAPWYCHFNIGVFYGDTGLGRDKYFFDGLIDEVAIYPRALRTEEIKIAARGWSRWSPYYKKGDEDDIVLFADDFNDGNVGIGGYWQEYGKGTWLIDNTNEDTGALKITGLSSANDTGIIQANNTNWYNYQVEAKVKLDEGGQAGIILNYNRSGSDNGYAVLLDDVADANQIRLYEMGADGVGTLKDSAVYTLAANTWYTLKAQYDGSKIRVYMGDKVYITYPSSTSLVYTYKGYAGLIAANTAKLRFDDFKVHPIDRYCRYEATLTDNMCNDTTPYLYWVRLGYEETQGDVIWSKIIQDRSKYPNLTPRDTGSVGPVEELVYSDIDGADTVWCYNLEDYDDGDPGENPDNGIKVNVSTPSYRISRVDLRLGIRTTAALAATPGTWPDAEDDYSWSDWRQHIKGALDAGENIDTAGDGIDTWLLIYNTTDLTRDFATEGGYIFQARAVSSGERTETDPEHFQPDGNNDRQDTSIIYMMRDITPPGSSVEGWPGYVGIKGYQPVDGIENNNWIVDSLKLKGVISYPEDANVEYRTNSEYMWINYLSQNDSGIMVEVRDKNPDSARADDCSGLKEKSSCDSPTRYAYSIDGDTADPTWWKNGIEVTNIDDWAECDTDYDSVNNIRYLALGIEDKEYIEETFSYSIGATKNQLDEDMGSTKGNKFLIQFAQKDKAGNWGYSHPGTIRNPQDDVGYYINYDTKLPIVEITAGPREANYSTSASFEFRDSAENDSCAFRYKLEQGDAGEPFNATATDYRTLTDYQPWLPTSREGSATYTDLQTTDPNWYECTIGARDEALNESEDSAVYVFRCLTPVPNTIIYAGPVGIVTSPTSTYSATFKFKAEGGTPTYLYAYKLDGDADWNDLGADTIKTLSLGYGNHTFRVRASNAAPDGDPVGGTQIDPTPACVTFTIEDPNKPSTVAPPSDPVKYWREESE